MNDEKTTEDTAADDAQSTKSGTDDNIKHSSDQPAEGDPDAGTGSGVSAEEPAEG